MATDLPDSDSLNLDKEWMKAWRSAAVELPKIRANELKQLDDSAVFELMGCVETVDVSRIGLAIQQTWFSRFHIIELQQALAASKDVKS